MKTKFDHYLLSFALVYVFKLRRVPKRLPRGVRVARSDEPLFRPNLLTAILGLLGLCLPAGESPFRVNAMAEREFLLIADSLSAKEGLAALLRDEKRLFEVAMAVKPGFGYFAQSGSVTMGILWALLIGCSLLAATLTGCRLGGII